MSDTADLRRVVAEVAAYYDQSIPPDLLVPVVPATGATAGIPGTWTPPDSRPPASVAALQAGTPNAVTATPAAAWTAGQFVQTGTAGAAGRATWSGTNWVGGVAPGVAAQSEPTPSAGNGKRTRSAT